MFASRRIWLLLAVAVALLPGLAHGLAGRRPGGGPRRQRRAGPVAGPPVAAARGHRGRAEAAAAPAPGECGRSRGRVQRAGRHRQRGLGSRARRRSGRDDGPPDDARCGPTSPRRSSSWGFGCCRSWSRPMATSARWPPCSTTPSSARKPARRSRRSASRRSRTALRESPGEADPDFACALLNSLGRLRDRESLERSRR